MACPARSEMVKSIETNVLKQLRADKVVGTAVELRAKAKEAAEKIVAKAEALATQDRVPAEHVTAEIRELASKEIPLPKNKQQTIEVSGLVMKLDNEFNKNPSNENYAKLLNAEIAHGYRNAKGERLVKLVRPKPIGSTKYTDPATEEQLEEYYVDTDGTMSKSANINKTLIDIDKDNAGENFNAEQSAKLTGVLGRMSAVIQGLQDKGARLRTTNLQDKMGTGQYNPSTEDITIKLDAAGPGAKFRNKFTMTNQEVYVHELVHAAMDFMFSKDVNIAKDPDLKTLIISLEELYKQAGKSTDWKTLLPGFEDGTRDYTEYEQKQAKDKWEYVFENKEGYGLHEFMASILTNEMFAEGMSTVSSIGTTKPEAGETFVEKLIRLFSNFVTRIATLALRARDNSVTEAGTDLIFNIMRANNNAVETVMSKHESKLAEPINYASETVGNAVKAADARIKKVIDPVMTVLDSVTKDESITDKAANEEIVKIRKELGNLGKPLEPDASSVARLFNIARVAGRLIKALPKFYRVKQLIGHNPESQKIVDEYAKIINTTLTSLSMAESGIIRSTLRDFQSRPGLHTALSDLVLKLKHVTDTPREKTYEHVLSNSKEAFGDVSIGNDNINLRHNEGLTDVILRTDIQALGVNAKGLHELLVNPNKVSKEIADLSKKLSSKQLKDTRALAEYMVTGIGAISNSYNISREFGAEKVIESDPEVVETIDRLASLIALDMTDTATKEDMAQFIEGAGYDVYKKKVEGRLRNKLKLVKDTTLTRAEYKEQVEDGVNFMISHARGLQKRSAIEMQKDPHHIIKGYMKETYDKDIEIKFAPVRDRAQLEQEGYDFIRTVKKPSGMRTEFAIYRRANASGARASGAIGLQDTKSRGISLMQMVQAESNNAPLSEQLDYKAQHDKFNAVLEASINDYRKGTPGFGMQPVFDAKGSITDFRVTMSHKGKKELMDMETRGTENLARSYSTMGIAEATYKHNEVVIDLLVEDYEENYEKNPEAYVEIKPTELAAEAYGLEAPSGTKYDKLWARLPRSTKLYAKEQYGARNMLIRKDMLEAVFGDDDIVFAQSEFVQKQTPKLQKVIGKSEKVWEDIMQLVKDNIIIKTPDVLTSNLISNTKMMFFSGINPIRAYKLMRLGTIELKRYESDYKEVKKLKRDRDSGLKVNESRITELEEALEKNTVAPLIDRGLYQSIQEDINTIDENNRLAKMMQGTLDKLVPNETANTAIQYLFMTKRTKPYQQLMKMTQVSDFYFRYTMYYDYLDKGLSSEEAFRNVTDDFINYDAHLNKYVRKGDKMGPFIFIRYFIRAQRVIKKYAQRNPTAIGLDMLAETFVTGDTPDIIDVNFLQKDYGYYLNPFRLFGRVWDLVSPAPFSAI